MLSHVVQRGYWAPPDSRYGIMFGILPTTVEKCHCWIPANSRLVQMSHSLTLGP